jgi:hypothetical protein
MLAFNTATVQRNQARALLVGGGGGRSGRPGVGVGGASGGIRRS